MSIERLRRSDIYLLHADNTLGYSVEQLKACLSLNAILFDRMAIPDSYLLNNNSFRSLFYENKKDFEKLFRDKDGNPVIIPALRNAEEDKAGLDVWGSNYFEEFLKWQQKTGTAKRGVDLKYAKWLDEMIFKNRDNCDNIIEWDIKKSSKDYTDLCKRWAKKESILKKFGLDTNIMEEVLKEARKLAEERERDYLIRSDFWNVASKFKDFEQNIRNFASSVYYYNSPRKGAIFAYPSEYKKYIDLCISGATIDKESTLLSGFYYIWRRFKKFIDTSYIKIRDALRFRYLPKSREDYLEVLRNSTRESIQDVFYNMYIYLEEGLRYLDYISRLNSRITAKISIMSKIEKSIKGLEELVELIEKLERFENLVKMLVNILHELDSLYIYLRQHDVYNYFTNRFDLDHLIHETEKLINKLELFAKKFEKQDLAYIDETTIRKNVDLREVFELANYILQYLHNMKIDNLILRFAVKVVLKYSDNKCATLMGDLLYQKYILEELYGLAGVEEDYSVNS